MKKTFTLLVRRLGHQLDLVAAKMRAFDLPAHPGTKFVDLAPIEDADQGGVYAEALLFATNSDRVFNIALTGPYGSGKSSVIRSFLKRYPRKALHISLAAFVPDVDVKSREVGRQEIERSILQQMLYGADADRLPLSRFKRIRSPGLWSFAKTLFVLLGVAAIGYLLQNREAVLSGGFLVPFAFSNWFHLGATVFAALFLWLSVHYFYVASFGVSLKSISLKDIEIRPASDNQDSILNRHLDEIIYFFQRTRYDLVVIEDLDRFNEPDIFVTLREINSLVNANVGVNRDVRFLYALRDDIFVSTDRTKFFEFIIPVIPIINASNSVDMMMRQGKRLSLDERLDPQFLREVSRYLGDLRLITNIFNEFAIYVASLETGDENLLDANKLLAVLIYKNVYPKDFELLHRGEGNLASILARHNELVAQGEAAYRSQIAAIERAIEAAERQVPADLHELRRIYAMALIEELPQPTIQIHVEGQTWIAPQQLAAQDPLEPWLEAAIVSTQSYQGYNPQVRLKNIQDKVDPHRSYSQRKEEIEGKSGAMKSDSLHRMTELRAAMGRLRAMKFRELIRFNLDSVEDLFGAFGQNGELARFLILEGYLDDTFYQYTSLFHSGRLSLNDNKFLIQIRAFITPGPDFPIDNAREVVAAMRGADFGQGYVLNVKLVDCLLSDSVRYAEQVSKLVGLISSEFDRCEEFLVAYYSSGQATGALLQRLVAAWDEFIPAALSSAHGVSHATQLLAALPVDLLEELSRDDELPEFVAKQLPEILARVPELAPERVHSLHFDVPSLQAIEDHPSMARALAEAGSFEITIENIEFVYRNVLGGSEPDALRRRNYTALRTMKDEMLENRVERDFATYLEEVLLRLEGNSDEDSLSILALLHREDLDEGQLRDFVARQSTLLPDLSDAPERHHAMLLQLRKVEPSWQNCLTFLQSGAFEADELTAYLDHDDVRAALLNDPIPNDPEAGPLREFIVEAEALSDLAYRDYVNGLPRPIDEFPESVDRSKRQILISERKVTLSRDALDVLADEADLQVLFVATNIGTYLADPEALQLDDDFRERLLRTQITENEKASVIALMDLNVVASLPERAAVLGPLLDRTGIDSSKVTASFAEALILHSSALSTKLSLLNKLNSVLPDDGVRRILAELPEPYSDIKTGYLSPRLEASAQNLALVRWLDSRNIISSWRLVKSFFSEEIRVNLYRR